MKIKIRKLADMTEKVIDARVRQKIDTLANWNNNELKLYEGEQAFVSDKFNFKIGDGNSKFRDLPWFYKDGVLGSIKPNDSIDVLNSKADGYYLAYSSGTYQFNPSINIVDSYPNNQLPDGYSVKFVKVNGSWSTASVDVLPMQDLTPFDNRITEVENDVNDFIENFSVEVDQVFDKNSTNAISNKAVSEILDSFAFGVEEIEINTENNSFGYVLDDLSIVVGEENRYIVIEDIDTDIYEKIHYNAFQAVSGSPSTSRVISILAVGSDNENFVLLNTQSAEPIVGIIDQYFEIPKNTTKLILSWANYNNALNSIPNFTLVHILDNRDAVKKYIDENIDNVSIGEELEGRNLLEFVDKNDNPFLEVSNEGILKVKGIQADIIQRSVNVCSTNLSGIISDEPKLNLPKPNHIAKVVIHGFPYVQTAEQYEVECMLSYTDRLGNGFNKKAIVAVQGSTSQGLPKKNLSIDLLNEDDSDFEIQFGDWVPLSSFHLKAEYWCVWHYRSLFSSQFFEQIDQSRVWHLQKPWRAPYSATNATQNQRFNTGARGHIDGFPIDVYIGDTFIGIYNWNQKKHRSNYEMKKDNLNHIIVDSASTFNAYFKNEIETAWEIRNPSGLKAIDGSKYEEGKELSETDVNSLQVKNAIKRFFGWGKNVSVSNLKTQAPNYLHIERTIDWFLHCHFLYTPDNYIRNTIWCTWDSLKWAPMVWDLEAVLGMGIFGYSNEIPPTKIGFVGGGYNHADGDGPFNPKFYQAFKTEIEIRYSELRELGIFTTENVVSYFKNRETQVPYEIFKRDMDLMQSPTNRAPNSTHPDGHNGGFYDSIPRIENWLNQRIAALDTYFNYNN